MTTTAAAKKKQIKSLSIYLLTKKEWEGNKKRQRDSLAAKLLSDCNHAPDI